MKPSRNERPDESLAKRLRQRFPTAKTQTLKRMVEAGRVTVNGKRAAKLSQVISVSDVVDVDERPDAARTPKRAPSARTKLSPLQLVHEDEDVLVVNKPPGLLTSTVPREPRPTALAIVRAYVESSDPRARVGLIHRLDRDAGGLLVFSKNNAAYESLKTQFFKHTVERVYEAVVHGTPNPPSGRIESRLVERADGSIRSTDEHAKGQRAITDYELLAPAGKGLSVIRLTLLTGRKHQIRVHLSERGWPIVGDTVYGGTDDAKGEAKGNAKGNDTGLMLRAVALAFDHPRTGKRVRFELSGFAKVGTTPANKKL